MKSSILSTFITYLTFYALLFSSGSVTFANQTGNILQTEPARLLTLDASSIPAGSPTVDMNLASTGFATDPALNPPHMNV